MILHAAPLKQPGAIAEAPADGEAFRVILHAAPLKLARMPDGVEAIIPLPRDPSRGPIEASHELRTMSRERISLPRDPSRGPIEAPKRRRVGPIVIPAFRVILHAAPLKRENIALARADSSPFRVILHAAPLKPDNLPGMSSRFRSLPRDPSRGPIEAM